jgi:hypothetical protein
MKKIAPGVLAGLLASAVLAAPALGAPANVTVRVEGEGQTLVPRTAVKTTTAPVAADAGSGRSCKGTGAMGAVHQATAGDYAGQWSDPGYLLTTIKGEYHYDPFPADPARYWAFWVNYQHMDVGLCDPNFELQEGDDVIILVDCYSANQACESAQPLRLSGLAPTVAPGQPVTVKVDEYLLEDPNAFPSVTTSRPSAGATITAAGQTATTAADGTATLTFSTAGPVSLDVSKANRVRTAALTCVTNGHDGNCGSQLPPTAVLGTENPDDKTAPVASFSGLKNGSVFSRKRAPRRLKGSVTPDPSGLRSVRLSIVRKHKGRCSAFDGATERFKPHRCGGRRSFRIGDRAEWSYLLPRKLPVGRYTIAVAAIDKLGNDSVTTTKIRVR